jgi:hypothetical protein
VSDCDATRWDMTDDVMGGFSWFLIKVLSLSTCSRASKAEVGSSRSVRYYLADDVSTDNYDLIVHVCVVTPEL